MFEGNYGAIDAYDPSYHYYCIIKFSASTYTFQADLIIDSEVISIGEIAREETNFFPIKINSHYYALQ